MNNINHNHIIVILLATVIGGFLRILNLGVPPFWIDEVLFVWWVQGGAPFQEFTTVYLAKLFSLHGEFLIRLPYAIAGTLTIPAIYVVMKEKINALYILCFVAVFPLFVYWSRMARPYAFAAFFAVLGWRYAWSYIIAVLTTPLALVSFNLAKWKERWYIYIIGALIAVVTYINRPDTDRTGSFLSLNNLIPGRRFYVIPLVIPMSIPGRR